MQKNKGVNMTQNNYLIDSYLFGEKYHISLVLPAYKATRGDLGYYWDLGLSLSIGGTSEWCLHIGLILGWLRIAKYKEKDEYE